jgi:hypothetical protein
MDKMDQETTKINDIYWKNKMNMARCDYICGPCLFQLQNCVENNPIPKIMGSLCNSSFSYYNYWIYAQVLLGRGNNYKKDMQRFSQELISKRGMESARTWINA